MNEKLLLKYNLFYFFLSLLIIFTINYFNDFFIHSTNYFNFYLVIEELIFFLLYKKIEKSYKNEDDILEKFYDTHKYYLFILSYFIFILITKNLSVFNTSLFFILSFLIILLSDKSAKYLAFNVKNKSINTLMKNNDFYYCCNLSFQVSLLDLLYSLLV